MNETVGVKGPVRNLMPSGLSRRFIAGPAFACKALAAAVC
jgi:hypothetical protein